MAEPYNDLPIEDPLSCPNDAELFVSQLLQVAQGARDFTCSETAITREQIESVAAELALVKNAPDYADKVKAIEDILLAFDSDGDNVVDGVANLQLNVNNLSNLFNQVLARVDGNDVALQNLSNLATQFTDFKTSIDVKIAELETKIGEVEGDVTIVKNKYVDIERNVTRIIEGDIVVTADTSAIEGDIIDIKDQIANLPTETGITEEAASNLVKDILCEKGKRAVAASANFTTALADIFVTCAPAAEPEGDAIVG